MAAYVKQADQIVLIFSKAEAAALLEIAYMGDDAKGTFNGATESAKDRALRAIETACTPSSRSGAAIP